jgi:FKBP-type peptidyl-prolyl cis-trans isomerase SlyD
MGRIISSTIAQNVLLHPGAEHVPLKALSEAMQDLKKGEKREIFLRAQEAYGFYDPTLVTTRRLETLEQGDPLKVDDSVRVVKNGRSLLMRVTELTLETVTLDGNHPLAGQDLVFEIQALDARDVLPGEIEEPVPDGPPIH